MNVGINEAGTDDFTGHVHFHMALISSLTHNQTLSHRDIVSGKGAGEHIHIGGVFQDQICLFPASSHVDDPLFFQQFSVDFS